MGKISSGQTVAALNDVTVEAAVPGGEALYNVSMRIQAGEGILIRQDRHSEGVLLFDLLEGLISPDRGTVEFLGLDWQQQTADEQARLRGRIGRVLDGPAWISNLDLYENLVLAQRHHTRRTEEELRREAERWMRAAGFATIPPGRTHLLRRDESRQAQWARAFMGRPALVLLEHPEIDTPPEVWERLIAMTAQAREEGTSVLWVTAEPKIWNHQALRVTRRYVNDHGHYRPVEESR